MVAIENDLLIALLAVRALGGQDVPTDAALLKALKAQVSKAKQEGWVAEGEVRVASTNSKGKVTSKKKKVIGLTPEGEQYLQRAASADLLLATAAPNLGSLLQSLEADRRELREEVVAALAAKGKGKDPAAVRKELDALAKGVASLAARLEKLEAALTTSSDESGLSMIEQRFDALTARLDQALQGLPRSTTQSAPPSAQPVSPSPLAPARSVRDVLRDAYERLRCFREFEDGLVPMPHLYHEAVRLAPGLSVADFRAEVETLWNARVLQCQELNEVREATEPDKAIRRGEKLYYFVYWPGA